VGTAGRPQTVPSQIVRATSLKNLIPHPPLQLMFGSFTLLTRLSNQSNICVKNFDAATHP